VTTKKTGKELLQDDSAAVAVRGGGGAIIDAIFHAFCLACS